MSADDGFATYLFEYRFEGAEWGLTIKARNYDDARARLRAIPLAIYKGQVAVRLPMEQPNMFPDAAPLKLGCQEFAARYGQDQYRCSTCGLVWDIDEPRPSCHTST